VINKQTIVGYLGRDPEVESKGSGVCTKLNVGSTEKFKGRDGEKHERTEWFTVEFWDGEKFKPSEILSKYAKKGSMIYIEGSTQTRTWDDKAGVKQYFRSVRGEVFKLLDRKERGDGPSDDGPSTSGGNSNDDIPF
jgi:single-strand DNA-binding protein